MTKRVVPSAEIIRQWCAWFDKQPVFVIRKIDIMKLTCPSCGAVASADAWENDVIIREAVQAVTSLPDPIPKVMLNYLSLFRPGRRALSWKKVLRLSREIATLAAAGHIQVQGKVARPCTPRHWHAGMEQMAERRQSLSLPLKNHNYLRQIVWQLADQEDAANERTVRTQELSGNRATVVRGERLIDRIDDVKVPPNVQRFLDKMKDKSRDDELNR